MKSKSVFVVRFVLLAAALSAISGAAHAGQIFVSNVGISSPEGSIGVYTTSGATINTSLVPGLTFFNSPDGIAVSGNILFTANPTDTTVSEYNATTGAVINASFITGLQTPTGLTLSGGDLFVVNENEGTIGEYTTDGATVNASLVTGLDKPQRIAISDGNLYVTNHGSTFTDGTASVGEYSITSGAAVNASLITGLSDAFGIAVSGGNLFVSDGSVNGISGTIGEYDATSGATINATLISGLAYAYDAVDLAASGGDLFVTNHPLGTVGEYTTSGTVVNASLISGVPGPIAITVVPEPSTVVTLLIGTAALLAYRLRRRRAKG